MKVKALCSFVDKHTRHVYQKGEEFECTETRLKEIQSFGHPLVEVVKARRKKVSEE